MDLSLAVLGLATAAYVSTNLDNFVVLLAFFGDDRTADAEVVLGQFLGIAVLVGMGLAGAQASHLVPLAAVGLLGLIPITLGLRRLRAQPAADPGAARQRAGIGLDRIVATALTAIGSGGDNVAGYVPLFAVLTPDELASTLAVFAILTAIWCLLARTAVSHPAGGGLVHRIGGRGIGVVFIALGMVILARAGTFVYICARLAAVT